MMLMTGGIKGRAEGFDESDAPDEPEPPGGGEGGGEDGGGEDGTEGGGCGGRAAGGDEATDD